MPDGQPGSAVVSFELNGTRVSVPACRSLLDALRDDVGVRSVKDGCSPQGQCGCCTVWIDGKPRVACVTPVARAAGRQVTTIEGLADGERWATAFAMVGASQCGFCTPGIIMRLAALDGHERRAVDQAMLAHLCRCTGWQTIREATVAVRSGAARPSPASSEGATRRAGLEGRAPQRVGPDVALGRGGFADDLAPPDALVAMLAADGSWVVADDVATARAATGKLQGRRTTAPPGWPIDLPAGAWDRTLQTTWVEPAYLEPDATWCAPGREPASPVGNGGAFGGKLDGRLGAVARRLADEHGRAVRVLATREDVVRHGPKRPPMAIGMRADGGGTVRVARTDGIEEVIATFAPDLRVELVDVPGPPTSASIRAAGWAEIAAVRASLGGGDRMEIRSPDGAFASAHVDTAEAGAEVVSIRVRCGEPLDEVVLRSYCIGAAHMALGWVRSEALSVAADGAPLDLTIRSFGVLRSADTPHVDVEIEPSGGAPVNGSDAVFAAVAAAAWRATGWAPRWPAR